MPKNTVTDLITDQEIAFALLIMSGTMTDRRAAEAVGLNPDTAAYTKAKHRVRAYMNEHRAAVREKLVDQEAEGLRKLNIGRDQILTRLWELATLSPEATRGSIAGQVKALSMIIAIEGLIPSAIMKDRRLSPPQTQPAAEEPGDPVSTAKTQPAAPYVPEPKPTPEPAPKPANDMSFPNLDRNQPGPINPFVNPERPNWIPAATDRIFDAVLHSPNSLRLSFAPGIGLSGPRR
jgi:hypothetical protein